MTDKTKETPKSGKKQDSFEGQTDSLGGSGRWQSSLLPSPTSKNRPNINALVDDKLFVDLDFPIGDDLDTTTMQWRRPKDICPTAQFIVDGATRLDVCQGILNDCWFLSAVASLSLYPLLLERVVPAGQSFQEGYNGSFHFRFWQYGRWEEVRVDDLLPTRQGKLVYMSSSDKHEFWSALLEKAYAKLKGGYRALNMGFPHEAMVDMTGGITEVVSVPALPKDLAAFLRPFLEKGALINCANSQGMLEERNALGILFRHAYSLTGLEQVKTKYKVVDLVRIRNPWGKAEWEGPWSDSDRLEWSTVSEAEQRRLNRVVTTQDGEFWMEVSDFRQNFDMMEVCHLTEESLSAPGSSQHPWQGTMHTGSWVEHLSAGGSPRGVRYWQNPQFHLTLLEEDDDPLDPELTCSFLVALMQKHQRRKGVHLAIALDIYKARSPGSYLSSKDLILLRPVLSSGSYLPRREVVIRGRLAPGHYVIIPSTELPNQQGEFLLRVLTEKGNAAAPAEKPTSDANIPSQPLSPHLSALPPIEETQGLFRKHCNQKGACGPLELHNLLTEVIKGGVLSGSEKKLSLEHCKSLVVLMDVSFYPGETRNAIDVMYRNLTRVL